MESPFLHNNFIIISWEGGLLLQHERAFKLALDFHTWKKEGPKFPIELSRKSDTGNVFAVIDYDNGVEMDTLWTLYKHDDTSKNIIHIISDILGCSKSRYAIGYSSPNDSSSFSDSRTLKRIEEWRSQHQSELFQSATILWCDFGPNFEHFSTKSLVNFISSSKDDLSHFTSILSSVDIDTPGREAIEKAFLKSLYSVQLGQVFSNYISIENPVESVKQWIATHTHFGRKQYVEYVEGNMPVIIAVPHGGRLSPSEIANRRTGCDDGDWNSLELSFEFFLALIQLCSPNDKSPKIPHIIICHLDRCKLDANRNILEAVDIGGHGHIYAEQAWKEYHSCIEVAKRKSGASFGVAHFFDIHGNSMSNKIMFGYLTKKVDFEGDINHLYEKLCHSSMRSIAEKKDPQSRMDLFVGNSSFSHFMETEGFPCTPYGTQPFDWGGPGYFNGGHSTLRHGSFRSAGRVNSTQVETPVYVRATMESRRKFGQAMARSTIKFFKEHYKLEFVFDSLRI